MKLNGNSFSPNGKRSWQAAGRSQGMVEFALALPILLMLLFAIIDFSLLFSAWLLIQNMSRQAVRYAVTGDWDPAHCTAACIDTPDQDQARIQSIRDVADSFRAGLMVDESAAQSDPGYLKVLVCSNKSFTASSGAPDSYFPNPGTTGSNTYSSCTDRITGFSVEDPGGGGDAVTVMVDFNSPFITPFLQLLTVFTPDNPQTWTMTHLVSAQIGVVEKFRTSPLIPSPVPHGGNTATPRPTFTPSSTFTPTSTFTPSSTASDTFTPTATNTKTPTNTRTYTRTPSTTASPTNTSTPTITYTPSLTYTPTDTFTPSKTPTITYTPTRTYTPSRTFTPSLTYTPSNTRTATNTRTPTRSRTPTNTRTITKTPSNTYTPSRTSTRTTTYTPSNTFTRTSTRTFTPTATVTYTPSRTFTPTNTFTPTYTSTRTSTPTRTNTPTPITPSPTKTRTPTYTPSPWPTSCGFDC